MSTVDELTTQALPVTASVALRIIETTPAVVKFNYDEMDANLEAVLVKYQGLTFTDSTASECKKTIAELRKGQKALGDFRIKTKKELTESVTDFEKQCKKLHDKFETVIGPLTTQNDQFELDRKEKKRVEVQNVIDSLIAENGLTGSYALLLIILEEYYNKGKSIKAIKAELSGIAKNAKLQQDKDEQDCALIKAKVELANAQYQLTNPLILDQYLRLLVYKSVAEVDALITSDAIESKANQVRLEDALIAEAAEAQKTEEVIPSTLYLGGDYSGEGVSPVMAPAFNEAPFIESIPLTQPATFQSYTARVTPALIPLVTAVYEITGTEDQLSALEEYLDERKLSWIDRPNG